MNIKFIENEYWYGGIVHMGNKFPIGPSDNIDVKLTYRNNDEIFENKACDQYSPLFLSSKGRYLHSNNAFDVSFRNGEILIDDIYDVELGEGYGTLNLMVNYQILSS